MSFPRTLDLFCRIIDNFGDVGVCWRLARQLAAEHDIAVSLWVDDLSTFHRICSAIDADCAIQHQSGVCVRRWDSEIGSIGPDEVADVVVEGFGCELPANYIAAMAAGRQPPVWINLEYLSAESWVEDCHVMQSVHPRLPLKKYFFFPGFTARTGGLLLERDLFARRDAFRADSGAGAAFLKRIGAQAVPGARMLSLFCYPHAPIGTLFDALRNDEARVNCLMPEGVATQAVSAFFGRPAVAGAMAEQAGLTVQVVPFLDQEDYDSLLWACDLNFVRGEDSAVRAQWAARPFVWQLYPQEAAAHLVKLDAFLDRYTVGMATATAVAVRQAWTAWNAEAQAPLDWPTLRTVLPSLDLHARDWAESLRKNGDLASNLVEFARQTC